MPGTSKAKTPSSGNFGPQEGILKSKSLVRAREWELALTEEESGGWSRGRKKETITSHGPTPGPSRPRSLSSESTNTKPGNTRTEKKRPRLS